MRLLYDQKGATMVMVALALTILLLFAGLALDFGRAHLLRAQLQTAVDAGALAGALQVVPMVRLTVDRWKAAAKICTEPVTRGSYPCLDWQKVSPAEVSGTWRELIGQGRWKQAVTPFCRWPYRCAPDHTIAREWQVLPPTTEPVAREALLLNATWPGGSRGARLDEIEIQVDHSRVTVKATAALKVPTHFLRLVGITEMHLRRSGTATPIRLRSSVSIIDQAGGGQEEHWGSKLVD